MLAESCPLRKTLPGAPSSSACRGSCGLRYAAAVGGEEDTRASSLQPRGAAATENEGSDGGRLRLATGRCWGAGGGAWRRAPAAAGGGEEEEQHANHRTTTTLRCCCEGRRDRPSQLAVARSSKCFSRRKTMKNRSW